MAAAALLVAALVPGPVCAKPAFAPLPPQEITVQARPIVFDRAHPEATRFGSLSWLGGVELRSPTRAFGGFSGLIVAADGAALTAVSDAGFWLTGTIGYDGARPVGLEDARMGSLLGAGGEPLTAVDDSDAEAITAANAGHVYIAFERRRRVGLFPLTDDGVGPARRFLTLPRSLLKAKPNSGIEGLALLQSGAQKGALVAVTENLRDGDGNIIGRLIGGPAPGPIAIRHHAGFDVTDLAALPDGGLLVLERQFSWSTGIRMRIRHIAAKAIRRGAVLDGEALLEAGPELTIDNMEAMAVHRNAQGQTVVTLLSDDNYNAFQRTLLLQFRID